MRHTSFVMAAAAAASLAATTPTACGQEMHPYSVSGVVYVDGSPRPTELRGVGTTPFEALRDALRVAAILMNSVHKAAAAHERQRLVEDLRAFAHVGGDWETLVFWTVPAKDWPVITVVSEEYSTADMVPGGVFWPRVEPKSVVAGSP